LVTVTQRGGAARRRARSAAAHALQAAARCGGGLDDMATVCGAGQMLVWARKQAEP